MIFFSIIVFIINWRFVTSHATAEVSRAVDKIKNEVAKGFAPLPRNPLIPFQELPKKKHIPTLEQISYLKSAVINPNPRMQTTAIVRIRGDSSVRGKLILEQMRNGPVLIYGELSNFPRYGKFGFHVHEFPIQGNDCESAGEHYNPYMTKHGGQEDKLRHLGDLGNIIAHYNGKAHIVITDHKISLYGIHSVLGRSLVVHENEDDLGTQPNKESQRTGNSGGRLACGTIELASM